MKFLSEIKIVIFRINSYFIKHKKIIGNSLMYFFAVGMNRGMAFLLLPLLTNILNPAEYGIVSIASIIIGLLKNVVGLNPSLFIIAYYFKIGRREITDYLSNIFFLIISSSLAMYLIYSLYGAKIGFFSGQTNLVLFVIFITALLMVVEAFVLTIIQMEKKGFLFLKFSLLSAFFQVFFILVLVFLYKGSWKGKIVGDFLAEIIICFILVIYLWKNYPFRINFSRDKLQIFLNFSLPLIPHTLSIWVMNFVDRFFIERIDGINSVGVYSAAYNVGMGLMLIYDALQRTWQPYFYEYIESNDLVIKKKIVKLTWLYYIFAIGLFIISTTLIFIISPYIFGKDFLQALEFIPLIFLGYTFHGMYRVIAGYLYVLNKNGLLSTITFASAILNVILNYRLISAFGPIGAAQSTAITFLFTFLAVKIIVIRENTMPWFYFLKSNSQSISLKDES